MGEQPGVFPPADTGYEVLNTERKITTPEVTSYSDE